MASVRTAKGGVTRVGVKWDGPGCCLVTNILGREMGKQVLPPQEIGRSRDCYRGLKSHRHHKTKLEN